MNCCSWTGNVAAIIFFCLGACQAPVTGPSAPLLPPPSGDFSKQQFTAPVPARILPARLTTRLSSALRREIDPDVDTAHLAAAETDAQGRLLVQLNFAPTVAGQLKLLDHLWPRFGASVRQLGTDVADLWVPVDQVNALVKSMPEILSAQLPDRPEQTVGAVTSQGVGLTAADEMHCATDTAEGVHVAVIDTSFASFVAAKNNGELGTPDSDPPTGGNAHGTGCAEILIDMAPGAIIHPVKVATIADLQAFAGTVAENNIQVVSDSLVWTGDSFTDGTGPHCAIVETVNAAGAVWVTSAGNHAGGNFYKGTFTDDDEDQRHEFDIDDEGNEFRVFGTPSSMSVGLAWDAFPETDIDFDLILLRKDGDDWIEVARADGVQDGTQEPFERIDLTTPTGGDYAIEIVRQSSDVAAAADMPLQIYRLVFGVATSMEHFQDEGSVTDIAQCENAIAVAAISRSQWTNGTILVDSSRGPTHDGRIKPDITAPSSVSTTTFGVFTKTSSATPHVAGAIALYIEAMGVDAETAAQRVLEDAEPIGAEDPNNTYGNGKLATDRLRGSWTCEPESTGNCETECGSTGDGICEEDQCIWASCEPPNELCNGSDDDCDEIADNGFDCAQGATESCTTSCDSEGTRTCSESCEWQACQVPEEVCNDEDDDCDGEVDEDLDCTDPDAGGGCASISGESDAGLWLLALLCLRRRSYRPRRKN